MKTIIAIKGHATRYKEVIEILEMLGGRNSHNYSADCDSLCFYIGKETNIIYYDWVRDCCEDEDTLVFTIEEFLEKFPYKVGDKVIAYAEYCLAQFTIQDMRWSYELNKVEYKICSSWLDTSLILPYKEQPYKEQPYKEQPYKEQPYKEQPYKEETEEEKDKKSANHVFDTEVISFDIAQRDKYELDLQGKFNVVLREGKYYVERIKPQYPKTYEECCDVFSISPYYNLKYYTNEYGYHDYTKINKLCSLRDKLNILGKLLICRDAYWKIAGEEMGLGKPWKPEWETSEVNFTIVECANLVVKSADMCNKHILAFPTEEMLDTFFEYFKELIEACKDFL